MDLITINKEIQHRMAQLDTALNQITERADKKAEAVAEYDKQLSIIILKIRAGKMMELDGQKVENPPASVIEKIARGICWKEALEMDKAVSMYKNCVKGIDVLQSQLNALQSLLRHME